MNKKRLGLIGGILLLTVGGIAVFNLNGSNFSVNNNVDKRTSRQKQADYLKANQAVILKNIQKRYPKIESVQFDWSAFTVNPISNGWITTKGYNLALRGKFNNLDNTDIEIDFYLENPEELPDVNGMGMHHHPMIKRDGGWWVYE